MRNPTRIPKCPIGPRISEADLPYKSLLIKLREHPFCLLLQGAEPTEDQSRLVSYLHSNSGLAMDTEPPSVTRIEVQFDTAYAGKDFTRKSRTSASLAPHTDTSFREEPHDLLVFQFVRVDQTGGESLLVSIDDLLPRLAPSLVLELRRSIFPFGECLRPILFERGKSTEIRYNRDQIELSALRLGVDISNSKSILNDLDEALGDDSVRIRFSAQAGEILLINNRKCLHGRSALDPESNRLMIRIRSYLPESVHLQ